ncbi:site-specific DNA-methyltransferase [Betaproteobacteria bacterium PRO7]|jgi:hypothetical protein|nr:site-specific DNA-methyltransferase [Betaproteobacteria bacterium PRO7]
MHHHKINAWLAPANRSAPMSTNQSSVEIPYQRWFKFKEAFSPQFVLDMLGRGGLASGARCLDPFGGCGTTGIAAQFAGVHPILIEVNPFIADLAEAKLTAYDIDALSDDFIRIRKAVRRGDVDADLSADAPQTLCEPGDGGRWVYPKEVMGQILRYRSAIEQLQSECNRRLLKVLLGSILVGVSNVTVNGKGRKYRSNWLGQQRSARDVDAALHQAFLAAIHDISRFNRRACSTYEIRRGSCLTELAWVDPVDYAIFSPPYPNSFDYTDIYNLELWLLGYLRTREDNRNLRQSTLRSHVQLTMDYGCEPPPSAILRNTCAELQSIRARLWDDRIPAMIAAYFADLHRLLIGLKARMKPSGRIVIVVGESSYAGIVVRSGHIIAQIARSEGYAVKRHVRLRAMRTSAQQGGEHELEERLIELIA